MYRVEDLGMMKRGKMVSWTKREEKNLPSSRKTSGEGKADWLQIWKKKKIEEKNIRIEEENLGKESALINRLLCPLHQIKEHKEALTETVTTPLLFSRQSAEASAEMCISPVHFNRSTRMVSLVNWHSKMRYGLSITPLERNTWHSQYLSL